MTTVTWPTDIVAQVCDFRLQKNTARSISPISRTVQTMDRQGKRWMATCRFVVGREKGKRIQALLDSGDEFLLWDMAHRQGLNFGPNLDRSSLPLHTYFFVAGSPGGQTAFAASGSPPLPRTFFSSGAAGVTVWGGAALGATAPLLDGFVAHTTPLLAGDYIEIGGYLYMLVQDLTTDGFGRGRAYLNRGVLAAAAHRAAVTRERPRARMLLADDDQNQRPIDPDGVWAFNLSFFEKLPV